MSSYRIYFSETDWDGICTGLLSGSSHESLKNKSQVVGYIKKESVV